MINIKEFIPRKFQSVGDINSQITFDILIENNISVILGEPASGKTFQLKNYSSSRKNILFKELVNIELEEVNIDNIDLIFLDSIDEALRDTSSISMKQLQDKLTKYINKCKEINPSIKFVLTCRQLEWNEYFANSIKEIDNTLKVYKILDLEKEQIDVILTEKQIDNTEFWSFISSNYLDFLLKNILVIFKIINNYDKYKTKTVNYTDIYVDIIKEHLTVKGEDRDELSTQKSLSELIDISSSLATYMILNRQSTISTNNLSVLTDELYLTNQNTITVNDLKILLSSSLFNKEGNSFAFFHKSIQEFLMAYFINKKSLNIETIKELFSHEMKFYEEFEEVIVYLTNLDNTFFNEIVDFDPLIFKRHPNLNFEQQEKLLATMLNKLKLEKSIIYGKWKYFDNNSLLNFNKLSNISHIVKENINENHLDKILYPYLIKLLHYNYHQELEDVIFKILENYNKLQDNQQQDDFTEEHRISGDIIKGNVRTRELIVDTFVDNFNINCRLYDFMKVNSLLNENIHKISMVSFEAKLFESLYGIKYTNRYSNPKKVILNFTNYPFDELLWFLISIPYRDLQYIVPYLKQEDSLKWFEFVKSQEKVNHKISLWAIYGLLLHHNSKEAVELVFEYLSRSMIFLQIIEQDIEDMPFEFEKLAENFWEVYFQTDVDNVYSFTGIFKILHISLDDIIKASEKYPIEKYTKYYVPLRLSENIDEFLMSNSIFELYIQQLKKEQEERQKKWDEEYKKKEKEIGPTEPSESLKSIIADKEIYEESKKSLDTFQNIFNVFIYERMYEEKNEHLIDETFSKEQKEQLLSYAHNNFKRDMNYLKFKEDVYAHRVDVTVLYIFYLKKLDTKSLLEYVNTKEVYEKVYWHVFRLSKMDESFFLDLTQEYFDFFIELFTETFKLSLEQSNNAKIVSLYDFLNLIEKFGKFNRDILDRIIKLISSIKPHIFLEMETYNQDELLKVLVLDKSMYDYIASLMKYDNFKSKKYLTALLKLNTKKTIDNYMTLYLDEEKYIKKSLWGKFISLFKKEEIIEVHKYNNPLINPIKINLLMNLLFSISSSKKIDLISDEYLNIIIQDYHEFFTEYKFQEGIVQYPDYDSMNSIINNIWSKLSASSDHISLLKELSSNKNSRISNSAKFYLDKAYNQQQKDITLPNSYYKAIFDSEEMNTKKVVNQGIYIEGNVQGNVTLTKN